MKSLILIFSIGFLFLLSGCLESGMSTLSSNSGSGQNLTYEWIHGDWGGCSVTACGTSGTQLRQVVCRDSNGNDVSDEECIESVGPKPITAQVCSNPACHSCSLDGVTVAHGQSRNFYTANSVACGQTCPTPISRTCNNGALSGSDSYNRAACTVLPCTAAPTWVPGAWSACSATACGTSGTQTRTVECRNSSNAVVPDSECASAGTKPSTSQACNAPACTSCTLDGVTVAHGASRNFYTTNSVACGQTCPVPLSRTCNNGTLSGSSTYNRAACSVGVCSSCPLPATLGGGSLASGQSITAYLAASVPNGQTCSSQTRTCANGSLSGTYVYSSCSVAPPVGNNSGPLVTRGQVYMQSRLNRFFFPNGNTFTSTQIQTQMTEKFNRYYTDTSWQPLRTIYVSNNGTASIASNTRSTPSSIGTALSNRRAGDMIYFLRGTYNNVSIQITSGASGTYDQPIVFYGERNSDGTLGVFLNCNNVNNNHTGSCINVDGLINYHAFDGFDLNGGKYGIRIVGGWQTTTHSRGNAILNCNGHHSAADPFFTGETDWFVIENNKAHHSGHNSLGDLDGHGIYISNGGDWNIVRYNELWNNMSSDFQVNSDPMSMCHEANINDNDPICDGPAFLSQGEGVSEFYWIEGNYFHNGDQQGANLTSVRNSVVIKNVMAFMGRHGFTFWQESQDTMPAGLNPDLGSSYNYVAENLFLNSRSHVLAFQFNSGNNEVVNNVVAAATTAGAAATGAVLVEVSGGSNTNTYSGNCTMGSNSFDEEVSGAWPRTSHTASFSTSWFANFNSNVVSKISDWNISASAPAGCPRLQFTDLK